MRVPGEVLLDIIQCLDRYGWDTLEHVSRDLANSVRVSMNSPHRVHYRRIDEVSCTGSDMLLSVKGELIVKWRSFY